MKNFLTYCPRFYRRKQREIPRPQLCRRRRSSLSRETGPFTGAVAPSLRRALRFPLSVKPVAAMIDEIRQ